MDINEELCEKFLKEKFDTRQWSYSAVSSFLKCPYSFYDTYILGNRRGNYHAYVGTSFHEVMEDYYNYVLRGGKELPLARVREVLEIKLVEKLDANPYFFYWDASIRKKLLSSVRCFVPEDRIKYAERKIEFKVEEYNFVGYLDLDEGAGKWHYDFKSKIDDTYYPQQYLYMYGKKQVDKTSPRGFGLIAYKEDMKPDHVTWEEAKDEVYLTVDDMVDGIRRIREALRTGVFPQTQPPDKHGKVGFFCTELCQAPDCPHSKRKS